VIAAAEYLLNHHTTTIFLATRSNLCSADITSVTGSSPELEGSGSGINNSLFWNNYSTVYIHALYSSQPLLPRDISTPRNPISVLCHHNRPLGSDEKCRSGN